MKKSSQEHSQRDRSPNLYVFCRKKYVVLGLNLTKYHTFSRYRTLYTSANFDNLTKRKSTASVTRFFCGYLPRILRNGKKNFKCLLTLQVIPQSKVQRNSGESKQTFCPSNGSGYFHCSERNNKSAVVCYYFIRAHQLRTKQST